MSLSKKFTAEFPHYVKNVGICATRLFGTITYRGWDEQEKWCLRGHARLLSASLERGYSTGKYSDQASLRVVSYNIMKFFNEQAILGCFDDYISQGFDTFLLQEVIVIDGVNKVQEYFSKRGFYTYFHPTSRNVERSRLMNFDLIGVMIASRYPIVEADFLAYDIVRPDKWWYHGEVYFGVWYARLQLPSEKTVGAYSTHAEWFTRPSGRDHQVGQLIKWIEKHSDDAQVIAWDFNSWLPVKLERFLRTFESHGFWYFRNKKPFASLDHIWIRWVEAYTSIQIRSEWSDHTAIACEVVV